MAQPIIALDWGSTNFRAVFYRPDQPLESLEEPWGLISVQDGDFESIFYRACGDWLDQEPQALIVAGGMTGAREGWREAGYCEIPLELNQLWSNATTFSTTQGHRVHILPGAKQRNPEPDLMRGEETQVLGALEASGLTHGTFCLPGTHSKWVVCRNKQIVDFTTYVTGELFGILTHNPSLIVSQARAQTPCWSSFEKGVIYGTGSSGLLHQLFSVRSLHLDGSLDASQRSEYFSGLLLGHELKHALAQQSTEPIHLIGEARLLERYQRALSILGRKSVILEGQFNLTAARAMLNQPADKVRIEASKPAPAPQNLGQALERVPLIAILRHLPAEQAPLVGRILVDAGFTCIETPLSDNQALPAIEALCASCGGEALIGAGTVLTKTQAEAAAQASARFLVSPHTDGDLIQYARELGLEVVPGFSTVSEAVTACQNGAQALKLFPAEGVSPKVLAAMKAILPPKIPILPVGSIHAGNMAAYVRAGAAGFGLGGSLYKPHYSPAEIEKRARELMAAWKAAKSLPLGPPYLEGEGL